MSKSVKIWLITATSLIVVGGLIFTGVMTVLKWDFSKLSTAKYITNSYDVGEDFNSINLTNKTADISIIPSDSDLCKVVCYEKENIKSEVKNIDGELNIQAVDTRKWYEHIGINFGSPKVTVYLPKSKNCALFIKNSTGDINLTGSLNLKSVDITLSTGDIVIENISADFVTATTSTGGINLNNINCKGDITAKVSTGAVNLANITCENLTSNGNTGKMSLKNVIASDSFNIERSTGDIKIDSSDAAEIFIETDTGSVTGTLLTEKVFIAKTDTGRIKIPETTRGGKCKITTDTGDIKIDIKP